MRESIAKRATLPAACLATLILSPQTHAQCTQHNGNSGTICCQPVGPDVIVGDIQGINNYTAETGRDAYALGTISCNIGNQNIIWQATTNQHPVVGQNMFKYRVTAQGYATFEQVGQSFLKHTFFALTQNTCGCGCSGQGGSVLGVGCSDPYTAARNGSNFLATASSNGGCGPKNPVNAATGVYPFPPSSPGGTGTTFRRLQVKFTELETSNHTSIRYFGECQYVTADDAAAGNKHNNASYREVGITVSGGTESTIRLLTGSGGDPVRTTQREQPGIRAWQDLDPTVMENDVDVPNDGRFIIASKATSLGGNQWHYEIAIQNLNSDRSGQSLVVPIPAGTSVSSVGFHDVDYHSGEPWDLTDWANSVGASDITWSTSTFAQNPNANALRWGTLYNFRFNCDKPPVDGTVTLGLFKNGSPGSVAGRAFVPAVDCNNNNVADITDIALGTSQDTNTNGIPDECEKPQDPCVDADFDNNGDINIDDLVAVITNWGSCAGPCPPSCIGDANNNCLINIDDLVAVITQWGACP